jgi:hypothetical protein
MGFPVCLARHVDGTDIYGACVVRQATCLSPDGVVHKTSTLTAHPFGGCGADEMKASYHEWHNVVFSSSVL